MLGWTLGPLGATRTQAPHSQRHVGVVLLPWRPFRRKNEELLAGAPFRIAAHVHVQAHGAAAVQADAAVGQHLLPQRAPQAQGPQASASGHSNNADLHAARLGARLDLGPRGLGGRRGPARLDARASKGARCRRRRRSRTVRPHGLLQEAPRASCLRCLRRYRSWRRHAQSPPTSLHTEVGRPHHAPRRRDAIGTRNSRKRLSVDDEVVEIRLHIETLNDDRRCIRLVDLNRTLLVGTVVLRIVRALHAVAV
mmetsp:Transcript_29928/g.84052  ORF Transcript_29928/g.84052 Transcript_29928/m.84052 type:complete len:252 (+) Transcript_29928:304-1059(+)